MKKLLFILLMAIGVIPASADRYQSLLSAKHLTVVTADGTTYYYILSTEASAMMRMGKERIVVGRDTFNISDVKSMRLRSLPRFVFDEDSTTFGKNYAIDHGLLALRRSLHVNKWNTLILPVALTGQQIRDAFGEDAMVAELKSFRQGDNNVVEFQTLNLNTNEVVMFPNCHYIIRPSRQPDLAEGSTAPNFGTARPKGPLYLIPNVSLEKNQSPKIVITRSEDETRKVYQQGTYTVRDDSRKLNAGIYYLSENGCFTIAEEPITTKAFTSWISVSSDDTAPLSFIIDGINEDLTGIFQVERDNTNADIYDLQGRKVRTPQHGLYLVNGKKVIIK